MVVLQGRRLTGTKHVVEAAEACGFRTSLVDLAGMPFGSQLQVFAVATSRSFGRLRAMCYAFGVEAASLCLT